MTEYRATCYDIPCGCKTTFNVSAETDTEAIKEAEKVLDQNGMAELFFVHKVESVNHQVA